MEGHQGKTLGSCSSFGSWVSPAPFPGCGMLPAVGGLPSEDQALSPRCPKKGPQDTSSYSPTGGLKRPSVRPVTGHVEQQQQQQQPGQSVVGGKVRGDPCRAEQSGQLGAELRGPQSFLAPAGSSHTTRVKHELRLGPVQAGPGSRSLFLPMLLSEPNFTALQEGNRLGGGGFPPKRGLGWRVGVGRRVFSKNNSGNNFGLKRGMFIVGGGIANRDFPDWSSHTRDPPTHPCVPGKRPFDITIGCLHERDGFCLSPSQFSFRNPSGCEPIAVLDSDPRPPKAKSAGLNPDPRASGCFGPSTRPAGALEPALVGRSCWAVLRCSR